MARAAGLPAVRLVPSDTTLVFTVEGVDHAIERVAVLEDRLRNPGPGLEVAVDLLEASTMRAFATEGASIHGRWAHLKPSTEKARRRRWGHYRQAPRGRPGILRWTTSMRESFRRGHPNNIRRVSRDSFEYGSADARVSAHQRGTVWLPRRVMLGFKDPRHRRQIILDPLHMWLRGLTIAEVRRVAFQRAGLAAA